MIKDIRTTFRQTLIYSIGNILIKLVGLILMPVYLNAFTLDQYGVIGLLEVTSQLIIGVFAFNLPVAMMRLSSEDRPPGEDRKIYFTAWVSLLVIVGVFLLLALPFTDTWSIVVLGFPGKGHYFTLLFISAGLEILGLLPLQLLRVQEKPGWYTAAFITKFTTMLGLIIYFVIGRNMGIEGFLWGALLSNLLMVLLTLPLQVKNSLPKFEPQLARELFMYGLPLVLNTTAVILLNILDKYILNEYNQLEAVGIYSAAYKIGSVVNFLLINSFTLGFLPITFKLFNQPGFDRFFSKMLTYFTAVTIIFTLGVCIFSQELVKLLSLTNPEFWAALIYIPLIAFGFIFKGVQYYFSLIFHLVKRTRFNAPITIIALLVNTGLNFWLIPIYDIMGAVIATGVSYFLMLVITYVVAQKLYYIHYELPRLGFLLAASAVFITVGYYLNGLELLWVRLPLKSLTFLAFPLLFYFLLADKAEKEKVKKIGRLLRQPKGFQLMLRSFSKDTED